MKAESEAQAQLAAVHEAMLREFLSDLHNVQYDMSWAHQQAQRWNRWSGNDENYGRMAVAT